MEKRKKRYAIVGTGERAGAFIDALTYAHRADAELVAMCDLSQTRMDWYNRKRSENAGFSPLPTYLAEDFEDMVFENAPDTVIVTTVDSIHHHYIVRAMEMGCDVISEKPMTTDVEKATRIFEAIERSGKNLRVTFNYRFSPLASKVRELIRDGVIGTPQHINFNWNLDTAHGADYFRRWHREKGNSGGLLVHKATHHFDLINWWIDSAPREVFAMGDLRFYGRKNAEARGENYSYERYTGEESAGTDPFALNLEESDELKGLYLDAESDSGYIRDRNVFGEDITTEDTLSVTARYENGALLTYSLVAYSPGEGCQIAITGDKGRLKIGLEGRFGRTFVACRSESCGASEKAGIRVHPHFSEPYEVPVPFPTGGHGGADTEMLEQIFSDHPAPDDLRRNADHIDGVISILMGVAANQSIETGRMINVSDLLAGVMPNRAKVTCSS
ncbi:MAG: Gfo/Idh/MocA family oxidoreductase [Verrucomicrobiales bacterium]|nr:Gfo/Idh/MocA family oxidoreductase [Verrucomicrobiales bacterium]